MWPRQSTVGGGRRESAARSSTAAQQAEAESKEANMGSHRAQEFTHNLLRITAGLFFLMHGGQKLLGWFGGMDGHGMTATLSTLPGVAGIIELVSGSLMLVG